MARQDKIKRRARQRVDGATGGWWCRGGKTAAPLKSLLSLFPDFRRRQTTIFFKFHRSAAARFPFSEKLS